MRLTFLKKHLVKHSRNSVSKSVDSKFQEGRSEGDVRAPAHPPPPPRPGYPIAASVIADLCQ